MAKHRNERSGDGGFVMGVLLGTALGAGLAMLLAPKAGSALRDDLVGGLGDLRQSAKDKLDDMTTAAASVIDKGREAYNEAIIAAEPAAPSAGTPVTKRPTT